MGDSVKDNQLHTANLLDQLHQVDDSQSTIPKSGGKEYITNILWNTFERARLERF